MAVVGLLCVSGLLACRPQTLTLGEQVESTDQTSSLYDALFGGVELERDSVTTESDRGPKKPGQ